MNNQQPHMCAIFLCSKISGYYDIKQWFSKWYTIVGNLVLCENDLHSLMDNFAYYEYHNKQDGRLKIRAISM